MQCQSSEARTSKVDNVLELSFVSISKDGMFFGK